MTDQEQAELRAAREEATLPVVIMAVVVALFAVFKLDDSMSPMIGGISILWGFFLLLQFRSSWSLLVSALVLIFAGCRVVVVHRHSLLRLIACLPGWQHTDVGCLALLSFAGQNQFFR